MQKHALRARAATSAPNFVRATAVPITSTWLLMKPGMGTVSATVALDETFHRDLDYIEK